MVSKYVEGGKFAHRIKVPTESIHIGAGQDEIVGLLALFKLFIFKLPVIIAFPGLVLEPITPKPKEERSPFTLNNAPIAIVPPFAWATDPFIFIGPVVLPLGGILVGSVQANAELKEKQIVVIKEIFINCKILFFIFYLSFTLGALPLVVGTTQPA